MKFKQIATAIAASTGLVLAVQAAKASQQLGSQLLENESEEVDHDGPLSMVVFGDSLAVGLGADKYADTPGYVIAKRFGAKYRNYARSGAVSAELNSQIDKMDINPDICILIVGTNDITHGKSMRIGIQHLSMAIDRLKQLDCVVFVVPCIDLEIVSSLKNPLRFVLGAISRRYAMLQSWNATKAGAHVIDPRPIYKVFDNKVLFSIDMFHPSSLGYKIIAEHIIKEIQLKVDFA